MNNFDWALKLLNISQRKQIPDEIIFGGKAVKKLAKLSTAGIFMESRVTGINFVYLDYDGLDLAQVCLCELGTCFTDPGFPSKCLICLFHVW